MGMTRVIRTVTEGLGSATERKTERRLEDRARGATPDEPMAAAERLVKQLAQVRSKFALDPVQDAQQALADAWMSPSAVREEDEAEYVDAVADCLGAGLPLEAALACWDSGELAYESDADDDEPPIAVAALAPHPPAGRRLVVR
jgi:hypothetical protein